LRYFENSTQAQAERSESEHIQAMHKIVEAVRSSEEIGVKYMQEWEERELERQKAHEEGRKSGLQEGADEQKKAIALEMKREGMEPEQIARLTKLTLDEIEKLEP
ncbi:hypothetical protein LI177_01900, partial [bacterium 210820-DFI.6.37]|nr:hypothetical protein [bacterium 210820-DFI.6.37]